MIDRQQGMLIRTEGDAVLIRLDDGESDMLVGVTLTPAMALRASVIIARKAWAAWRQRP